MLSNEEFTWDREGLTDARPVCGPSERISTLEVDAILIACSLVLWQVGARQMLFL